MKKSHAGSQNTFCGEFCFPFAMNETAAAKQTLTARKDNIGGSKQRRKHGYPSRVQVGRGSDIKKILGHLGRSIELKKLKNAEKV